MKIIQLGHIDNVRFACPICGTIWEQSTDEVKEETDSTEYKYYVECPLCENKTMLKDGTELAKFIRRRKELEEKL